jgi:hypothetical protein
MTDLVRRELPVHIRDEIGTADFVTIRDSLHDVPRVEDCDSNPATLLRRTVAARGIKATVEYPDDWAELSEIARRHAVKLCRVV